MLTGLAALESTNWSKLHHAYGRADDTPGHLRALLQDDPKARGQALEHLGGSILHQGTPGTATGPAALVVAGLLSDERIDQGESIRAYLLSFLASVAEVPEQAGASRAEFERLAAFDMKSVAESEDDPDYFDKLFANEKANSVLYARAVLGCIQAAPVLLKAMWDGLENPIPRVRACAARGAVILVRMEALRQHSPDLEAHLLSLAQTAQDTDERSSLVLALGELGHVPLAFLEDPSPAVCMCAALAPGLATNLTAIDVLLQTLTLHAGQIDDWFVQKPPQFVMRPRFPVVARLIQQVKDFDRLAEAATAVARITSKYCVDDDWGPLLAAAFADGSGVITTEAQRRFLSALVTNREIWTSRIGNAHRWFKQAGIPYDRAECLKRIEEA